MASAQGGRLLAGVVGGLLAGACSSGTTIHGTVVGGSGAPIVGQLVIIYSGAFSQRTVTDSHGAFTVADAPSPYNAALIFTGETHDALVYAGLTRLDPTFTPGGGATYSATVSGQFSGGRYPEPPGYVTSLAFGSPRVLGLDYQEPISGRYTSNIAVFGPSSLTGTLYALQAHVDAVSGLPVDYPGYGALSGITLQDGVTLANRDISLGPVSTGTLTGTINVPPSYNFLGATVSLLAGPGALMSSVVTDVSQDASFTYVTPAIPGTSLILGATAQVGEGVSASGFSYAQQLLSASASDVVLTVPAAPTLLQPAGGSAYTVGTPFSWTWSEGSEAVYIVDIVGPFQSFSVFTAATTFDIPDLADAGVAIVPSATYLWEVYGLAPIGGGVDQVASPYSFQSYGYGTYAEAMSNQQYFNTSP
jgi:hypothetical protein